jgi:hypothetical protein
LGLFACSDASPKEASKSNSCKELADDELIFDCAFGESRVLVTKQNGEGFSNADLTMETAEKLSAYQLDLLQQKVVSHLGPRSRSDTLNRISADTILIVDRSNKIVQTKFLLDSVPFAVGYASFPSGEFTRVLCLSYDVSMPVNLPGKCADTVLAEFGFDIRGKKYG